MENVPAEQRDARWQARFDDIPRSVETASAKFQPPEQSAEDLLDLLDGLVEKTRIDPAAPFNPDTVEQLAALKKKDSAAFDQLRAQLKSAGCRIAELDRAIAAKKSGTGGLIGPHWVVRVES